MYVDQTLAETAQQLSSYILKIGGGSHQAISLHGKLLQKRQKQSFPFEKYLGVLPFDILVFEFLDLRSQLLRS